MTDATASKAPAPGEGPVRYVPAEIETKWMRTWLDSGAFAAVVDESKPSFSIALPPPNITGALHMGHALNLSVQDALSRFKRMTGHSVLWQPGIDHAGIATQAVVEKELKKEGTTRHELGRANFLERVWTWKEQSGSTIFSQFQRMGASLDYSRERFTMDEAYARAVQQVFVHLYDKGYIYRAERLINWDGGSRSAISDLEIVQKDLDDEMVQVDYALENGSGHVTIATVRPETIPADVAIAVHPTDARYSGLVGRNVRVPFTDRLVPIVADDHVDPEFGTGALKITPGHDPNDFEIGERHGLEVFSAIAPDLTMTDLCGEYAGMDVSEARAKMTDRLDELGVLRGRESYRHAVPHSERSGVRIEPLVSLQWFCDMTELAKPAVAAVQSGEVRFVPPTAVNIFNTWMDDLKPWCLSRQLWWGHQLPVWYRDGETHVSLDGPADAEGWTRDEDVLDTWFSSGLWDFATLGWPEESAELAYFHPTSVLVTAREIINLWVARMMMLSYEFMGEKPFTDVYIHSVIQASDGRRMSKSLGTGIDPVDLIEEFGADATRYGMLQMSSTQDARFNKGKIQEGRDLANKLWNASRLLLALGDASEIDPAQRSQPTTVTADSPLEDRWIIARLAATSVDVTRHLDEYDFAQVAKTLYAFVWNELCDWYLEAVKPRLRDADPSARAAATGLLAEVLDQTLRLVHVVMPHVTEEIRSQLWPTREGFLMNAAWPTPQTLAPLGAGSLGTAEADFDVARDAITLVRSVRAAADIASNKTVAARLDGVASTELVATLAGLDLDGDVDAATEVAFPLAGGTVRLFGLDAAKVRSKLEAEQALAGKEVARAEGKLGNAKFTDRAPAELVDAEREKVRLNTERAAALGEVLAGL